MYILKNAFVSIARNKGRNILMGIIILVIACSTTVSLAILNTSNSLIESYQNKYDITANIGINRENMMQNFKPGEIGNEESETENKTEFTIPSLTEDEIENYGNSDYVSSYYYTFSIGMNASNIEKASSEFGKMDRGPMKEESSSDFTITGYNSYDAMSEFIEGTYTITDGEVSSDFESNNCIINEELATLNELSVGDTITLTNSNDESKTYELKITGIFKDNDESEGQMSMFTNSVNTIITNVQVVRNIVSDDSTLQNTITPNFVLTSKDVIEDFTKEVEEKGLNEVYSVTTNLDQISQETESIQNLKSFAITFLIITFVIGGIVLLILNMINVRERKYEIGVLRTIGMKKSLVISQFVTELLTVSIVALLLGGIIGSATSVPVANKLLEQEIENSTSQQEEMNQNFGKPSGFEPGNNGEEMKDTEMKQGRNEKKMNGVLSVKQVDSIHAVVDIKVLLQLFGFGILLTLFSSLSAMISISKFSPLDILKERS